MGQEYTLNFGMRFNKHLVIAVNFIFLVCDFNIFKLIILFNNNMWTPPGQAKLNK